MNEGRIVSLPQHHHLILVPILEALHIATCSRESQNESFGTWFRRGNGEISRLKAYHIRKMGYYMNISHLKIIQMHHLLSGQLNRNRFHIIKCRIQK